MEIDITKEIKGSSNVLALQCTSHKSIPIPITAIYKGTYLNI